MARRRTSKAGMVTPFQWSIAAASDVRNAPGIELLTIDSNMAQSEPGRLQKIRI